MSVFGTAIDDLFADPNLACDAVWRAGGVGPGTFIRVIARQPDRIGEFGETHFIAATHLFDVRVNEVALPAAGDTLEIDRDLFIVQGEPMRDSERLVWTLEARPA
jgi:hypothetical protein